MIVIFADHRIWDQSQASVNKNIKPRFVCGLWQRKLHLFLQQVRDMRERVSCGVVERMDGVEMARNDSQSVKQSVLCHQSVSYVVIITHYLCTQYSHYLHNIITSIYIQILFSSPYLYWIHLAIQGQARNKSGLKSYPNSRHKDTIINLFLISRGFQCWRISKVFVVITEFFVKRRTS